MKKRIAAVMVCLAIAAISVSGTLAYFTSDDTATNVITSGNIKIDLIEMEKTDEGLVPFEDKDGIMPGDVVSKIVTVKNIGDNPAFIRVKADKKITLAQGVTGEADLDLIQCDFDTEHWTYHEGYYYYNEPLAAEAETFPLFTTVTFDKTMDNKYQNCQASINVKAQAVQVKNNGASAKDAAGWPAE